MRSITILPISELGAAANFLNENFHGWSMEKIRRDLERRVEQERYEYDQLIRCRRRAIAAKEHYDGDGKIATDLGGGASAILIASQVDRDRLRQLLARWRRSSG